MNDTDLVFQDVMRYSEGVLPAPDEFTSRSQLKGYLERANADSPSVTSNSLDFMLNSRRAEDVFLNKVEESTLKKLRKQKPRVKAEKAQAVNIELQRSDRARLIDESQTKNVVKNTGQGFIKWRKNPERFDFQGVDTKTHTNIKDFIREKARPHKFRGTRVFNDRDVHVFVVKSDKRGRPFAQNIITGRRVPKTAYSRFGMLRDLVKRK